MSFMDRVFFIRSKKDKVTLQSRLVLELQTIDSQARIGKNRGSRLLKSEGSGHLLVQVFHQKKGMH